MLSDNSLTDVSVIRDLLDTSYHKIIYLYSFTDTVSVFLFKAMSEYLFDDLEGKLFDYMYDYKLYDMVDTSSWFDDRLINHISIAKGRTALNIDLQKAHLLLKPIYIECSNESDNELAEMSLSLLQHTSLILNGVEKYSAKRTNIFRGISGIFRQSLSSSMLDDISLAKYRTDIELEARYIPKTVQVIDLKKFTDRVKVNDFEKACTYYQSLYLVHDTIVRELSYLTTAVLSKLEECKYNGVLTGNRIVYPSLHL